MSSGCGITKSNKRTLLFGKVQTVLTIQASDRGLLRGVMTKAIVTTTCGKDVCLHPLFQDWNVPLWSSVFPSSSQILLLFGNGNKTKKLSHCDLWNLLFDVLLFCIFSPLFSKRGAQGVDN